MNNRRNHNNKDYIISIATIGDMQMLCATLKDDTTVKNEQKSERQNTYASAKSKELHPHAPSQRNAAHLLLPYRTTTAIKQRTNYF
jgi:hypothetical protein